MYVILLPGLFISWNKLDFDPYSRVQIQLTSLALSINFLYEVLPLTNTNSTPLEGWALFMKAQSWQFSHLNSSPAPQVFH